MNTLISLVELDIKHCKKKKILLFLIFIVLINTIGITLMAKGEKSLVTYYIKGPVFSQFDLLSISLWIFPYIVYHYLISDIIYDMSPGSIYIVLIRLNNLKKWVVSKVLFLVLFNFCFQSIFYGISFIYYKSILNINIEIIVKIYILSIFNFLTLSLLFLYFYCLNLSNTTNLSLIISILVFNVFSFSIFEPFSKYIVGNQGILALINPYYDKGLTMNSNILITIFYSIIIFLMTLESFQKERTLFGKK